MQIKNVFEILNPQRQVVSLEDRLLKRYEVDKGQAKECAKSGALNLRSVFLLEFLNILCVYE